jgi:hypothetical protein
MKKHLNLCLVHCQFTMTGRNPNFSLEEQDKPWTPTRKNQVDRLLGSYLNLFTSKEIKKCNKNNSTYY